MSDSEGAPRLPPEEEEWIRRFFWVRGLPPADLAFAVRMSLSLAKNDLSHTSIRLAAITVLQTLNELASRREWILWQARRWGVKEEDAEDLAQDVFSRALQDSTTYRLIGGWTDRDGDPPAVLARVSHNRITSWLFRLLRQRMIDRWRTRAREISLDTPLAGGGTLGEVLPAVDDLPAEILSIAVEQFLQVAEAEPARYGLKPYDTEIARLRWFEDRNIEEIAKHVGRSISTVHAAETRARAQLRKWLEVPISRSWQK